jgi:uncharacterized protein (DUF58 family)
MLPAVFTPQFLARLETLKVRSRRKFQGSRPGGHLSPRRGAGLEFADYRRYTPGDDLRYIDWKLYCRTDRHYIKLFQEEEDLYTYLFLDLSASMGYPVSDDKYGATRDIALALAYIVLAGDDAVKLHALTHDTSDTDETIDTSATLGHATPFFRSRRRFVDITNFFDDLKPAGSVHPPTALTRHLHNLHRPGKAIWLSDFLFPIEVFQSSLNLLRAANFDLAVVQVLGKAETDPPLLPAGARFVDSESGGSALVRFDAQAKKEYVSRLERHNRELRSVCHQAGVHHALFVAGQERHAELQNFVLRELPALGLLN